MTYFLFYPNYLPSQHHLKQPTGTWMALFMAKIKNQISLNIPAHTKLIPVQQSDYFLVGLGR